MRRTRFGLKNSKKSRPVFREGTGNGKGLAIAEILLETSRHIVQRGLLNSRRAFQSQFVQECEENNVGFEMTTEGHISNFKKWRWWTRWTEVLRELSYV